jgi:hypothetical protein
MQLVGVKKVHTDASWRAEVLIVSLFLSVHVECRMAINAVTRYTVYIPEEGPQKSTNWKRELDLP